MVAKGCIWLEELSLHFLEALCYTYINSVRKTFRNKMVFTSPIKVIPLSKYLRFLLVIVFFHLKHFILNISFIKKEGHVCVISIYAVEENLAQAAFQCPAKDELNKNNF